MTRDDAVIDGTTTDQTDPSTKDQTMSEPTIDDETTDAAELPTTDADTAAETAKTADEPVESATTEAETAGETADDESEAEAESDEAFDAISIVFDDIADTGIDYDIAADDEAVSGAAVTDGVAGDEAQAAASAADDIVEANAARVNETLALATTTTNDGEPSNAATTANDGSEAEHGAGPAEPAVPAEPATGAGTDAPSPEATAPTAPAAAPGVEPTLRLSARLDAELRQRGNVDDMLRDYPALALAKVTVADHKTGRNIIDRVSAEFRAGHIHAIRVHGDDERVALMSVVTGMMRPTDGAVMNKSLNVLEIEPGELLAHRIGVIPQRYAVRDDLNAEQNLLYAMDASGRTFLKPKPVYARELLQRVGFDSQTPNTPLAKLPAVERRLVAVARAICCDAEVIVADEPTGGLDADDAVVVLRALMALTHGDPKRCVVIVTADDEVAEIAETVTYLSE